MKKIFLKSFCARCLTLLVLALMSTNLAWGADETVQFSFTDKDKLQGWTSNPAPSSCETASPTRGLAWSKTAITSFSYTLSDYGVSKVSIEASANNAGYTLFVNGGTGQTVTKSNNTTYNFDIDVAKGGTITISTTKGDNVKSFWIKSITLTKAAAPAGPSLSVSPATIDFGEVYQNATVDAKDVTVTFANLTTNDVAAAISGSVFSINKKSSFTSGDKITITPNTTTLGEYSETLTVSATGVESKEVTIIMNVVEAPSWIYKHVTDASTLKDGDVIVFGAVKENNYYVNGSHTGTNKYLDSKDATCEYGILESSDAVEIALIAVEGGWNLKIDDKYINTTAEKALTFADDASTAWTISIDENGDATIAAGDYGRFLYNATNPRFLNYTSATSASMLLPQIYRKEVSAKITSTGYATFSSDYALNLSNLPEGLTAYKATTAGNGKVHMVAVEEAVAASTGLFLKGTANTTYTIPVAASGTELDDNLLEATNGGEVEAGDYVYVIASGAFQPLANNTVVSKGKAYIPASAITTEGKLEITFNEPTGIENLKSSTLNPQPSQYNLQGVRVNENYKGIVIMNGKKYINK